MEQGDDEGQDEDRGDDPARQRVREGRRREVSAGLRSIYSCCFSNSSRVIVDVSCR